MSRKWKVLNNMKANNLKVVLASLTALLLCSLPAEASTGSLSSNAGIAAMVIGVAVTAYAMKKFME